MHALLFERAAEKPRGRSRTLVVKDGTVWMWPGVPLTVKLDGRVYPLPEGCVRFWITRLHGFEADPALVGRALRRSTDQLTLGDHDAAQTELDRSSLDRLSPEGDALMAVTAKRLGVPPARMPVGFRSAPGVPAKSAKTSASSTALPVPLPISRKPGTRTIIRASRRDRRIVKAAGSPPRTPIQTQAGQLTPRQASVTTADLP